MNETLESIQNRYSCRSYTGQAVEREKLEAIALAGAQAPSAANTQAWHISVVSDKTFVDELNAAGIAAAKAMEDQGLYGFIMSAGGSLFYNASAMMVVSKDPAAKFSPDLDCGIVVQNIALAAESLGVASCICAMVRIPLSSPDGPAFIERLAIPEGHEFAIAILLGYATEPGTPHEVDSAKITYVL